MNGAWQDPGFCVPNAETYPHQWLWDSCFHAIVWSALQSERSVIELRHVLANQDPGGFVPHLTYWNHPDRHRSFWGRSMTSIITQPPMYGHAVRRLIADGQAVDDDLLESVGRGLRYLLRGRLRTQAGLIPVLHPWESGCDDSPRWDSYRNPAQTWGQTKGNLVGALRDEATSAGADRFAVGSIGFNALVVWNAFEYLSINGAPYRSEIEESAAPLVALISERWDDCLKTWVDDGPASGSARTLDALLALLVDSRSEVFDQLLDGAAFGARYGPRGVHLADACYSPDVYWRGPAWPQLTYLLWVAACRSERRDVADSLARSLIDGAVVSGFAEYWNPETGEGLGAVPQTWAALALVVAMSSGHGSGIRD